MESDDVVKDVYAYNKFTIFFLFFFIAFAYVEDTFLPSTSILLDKCIGICLFIYFLFPSYLIIWRFNQSSVSNYDNPVHWRVICFYLFLFFYMFMFAHA